MPLTPTWYDDAVLLLAIEHSWSGAAEPGLTAGPDAEEIKLLLEQVRPDALQVTAKGSAGYVPFATRHGNRWPAIEDNPWFDPLSVYQEAAAHLDIRFVLGYSGLIDLQASYWRSEWQRLTSSRMAYRNQALCPNSGYVEEMLLPQLDELLERYRPDGIVMDHENLTVSPCYCTVCESEFQMMHERSAPVDASDTVWNDWLKFHRESFQRYLNRVARYLDDRQPGIVFASNGAHASHQAEEPATDFARLTWDLSPAFAARQASLESRALAGRNRPFDLAVWNRCSARPWAAGSLPALPVYPKTTDHLLQDGAVILANGGRLTLWVTADRDGTLRPSETPALAMASGFARARREWLVGSQSAARAAILHSDATHEATGNGLYDPGPSLDRIRGAHQALTELHVPCDILNEDALLRSLHEYQLLVLPEQIVLRPDLDEWITEWVRHGGRLLATGRVSPRVLEAIPTFAMEEVLGIRWTGRRRGDAWFESAGAPVKLSAPVVEVGLYGADTIYRLLESGNERHPEPSGYPAVSRNRWGEGEAWYIAADFFTAYHRSQYPGLRELLREVLSQALPEPALETDAPTTVELTLRHLGARVLVHMVNHNPGKSLAQNSAFIEAVPAEAPFRLSVCLPAEPQSVFVQPGEFPLDVSWDGRRASVHVPAFHLHQILEFRLPGSDAVSDDSAATTAASDIPDPEPAGADEESETITGAEPAHSPGSEPESNPAAL